MCNSSLSEQPFQFKLSITLAIFSNSYFSEQLLFRTGIFHNSYLQEQPSEVFCKKSCPKTFRNIHRKIPLGLQDCCFIKKRLQHRCFPVNIANFLRTAILKNIWERLLLHLTDFSEQLVFRETIFQNSFLKVSSLKLSYFSSHSQIKLFNPFEFLVEQRATSNEQRVKSNQQRAKSNEQRAKSNEQQATSKK